MRFIAALLLAMVIAAPALAQTPVTTFPFSYTWTGPTSFAKQSDGRTYIGGDTHWGTYIVPGGNSPQFQADAANGRVSTNSTGRLDTLYVPVDATGRTFFGREVFTFSASRGGGGGPTGTMQIYANSILIQTIDVATGLGTSMQSFSASLPASVGNSIFTVSIIVISNKQVNIDNTGVSGGVLPITLASFNLMCLNQTVELHWSTVTETENYGFYVQKSENMTDWADIASSFQAGYGTTVVPHAYSFTDATLPLGKYYRLRQVDLDGTSHFSDAISGITSVVKDPVANEFGLNSNYPNPFNPSTTISFRLSRAGHTNVTVYTLLGERVTTLADEILAAGDHSMVWNPSALSSGTYVCVLTSGSNVAVRKMSFVK
jgi:hypothetical protein